MTENKYQKLINEYLANTSENDRPEFIENVVQDLDNRINDLLTKKNEYSISSAIELVPYGETSFGEYVYGFLEYQDAQKLGFKEHEILALSAKLYINGIWVSYDPSEWRWFLFICLQVADLLGKAEAAKTKIEEKLDADKFIDRMTPMFIRGVQMAKGPHHPKDMSAHQAFNEALVTICRKYFKKHHEPPSWKYVLNDIEENDPSHPDIEWDVDCGTDNKSTILWSYKGGLQKVMAEGTLRNRLSQIKNKLQ